MSLRLCAGLAAGFVLLLCHAQVRSDCCPIPIPSSVAVPPEGRDDAIEKLMKRFKALYKERRYHEAEEVALEARRLDPKGKLANSALFLARRQLTTVRGELRDQEDAKALQRRLATVVNASYRNIGLSGLLADLAERYGVKIAHDEEALAEAGVDLGLRYNFAEFGADLRAVLDAALDRAGLQWQVKGGVVAVERKERLTTQVYAVADLVVPCLTDVRATTRQGVVTKEAELIKTITSTISPKTWSETGGCGTIDYHPLSMALVVHQTPDIQEQVQDLLAGLRRAQDQELTLELCLVTVRDDHLKQLAIDLPGINTPSKDTGVTLLDEARARALLEAVQRDRFSVITQAPRLTLFNGQTATVELAGGEARVSNPWLSGMGTGSFAFVPFIQSPSPDLLATVQARFAPAAVPVFTLGIDVAVNRPRAGAASPRSLHAATTVKLPEGRSALVCLSREGDDTPELGQPDWVAGGVYSAWAPSPKEHVLVLVTPRVVRTTEKQEAVPAAPATDPKTPSDTASPAFVNSRSFTLAYDVANVGPSEVAAVEVYYTRDGGPWEHHPEQVRPLGSLPVTVLGDGRFGFTLVAQSGAGLSKPAPREGEAPQVWVEVDTTPPDVELFAPRVEAGSVVLTWKASDRNLGDDPVSIEWAANPDGPWHAIDTPRLANTGRYDWALPGYLPARAYFRLSARDRAGNTGVATTPQPVAVDVKVPEVIRVRVRADRRGLPAAAQQGRK